MLFVFMYMTTTYVILMSLYIGVVGVIGVISCIVCLLRMYSISDRIGNRIGNREQSLPDNC